MCYKIHISFLHSRNSQFVYCFGIVQNCQLHLYCHLNVHTSKTQQRKSQTSNRFPFINLVFHPLNHTHTQSHAVNMLCRNEQHLIVKQNDFVILFRCVSGNKFVSNWKAKKTWKWENSVRGEKRSSNHSKSHFSSSVSHVQSSAFTQVCEFFYVIQFRLSHCHSIYFTFLVFHLSFELAVLA